MQTAIFRIVEIDGSLLKIDWSYAFTVATIWATKEDHTGVDLL
jgi:hypothetical protein